MPRGGPRNRGPLVRSGHSEAARLRHAGSLVLPAEGHQGDAPAFPLPGATDRELVVWREAWTTPQAVAWSDEPWRWRTIALWARWSVRTEADDASASVCAQTTRLADQIGLTPAGLSENQWRIADPAETVPGPGRTGGRVTAEDRRQRFAADSMRDRLRSLDDDRPTALERARRRAEERAHEPDGASEPDPRHVLRPDYRPNGA